MTTKTYKITSDAASAVLNEVDVDAAASRFAATEAPLTGVEGLDDLLDRYRSLDGAWVTVDEDGVRIADSRRAR